MRLFVGNLSDQVTEAELREYFSAVGPLAFVRLPTDRDTGKPRGIAFIEFTDAARAGEAIRRFHHQPFQGKPLIVNEARAREPGPHPGHHPSAPPPSASPGRAARSSDADGGPAPRGEARREFGPDAAPRARRKPTNRYQKTTHAPKGPMRERFSGQFFGGDEDETDGDTPNDGPLPAAQG